MASQRPPNRVLWLVILAAPVALGFETTIRLLFFPDDFEMVREFLHPFLTPVAWALGLLAAVGGFAGLALQRRMSEKRLARLPPDASVELRYQQVFGVFLLTTAVPQIPSVLATITFTFGASIWPVLVGIVFCSAGVVAQARRVASIADAPPSGGSSASG